VGAATWCDFTVLRKTSGALKLLFTKPKKAIGLDIGTHAVKAIQMARSGKRLCVEEAGYALVDKNQVNNDPVQAHADAVREALRNMDVSLSAVVGGLQGQTVVIRYPRLPESAKERLAEAVQQEAGQNIPYDLDEVMLDWTLLDEIVEGDQKQLKILLVAAKHEIIDSRVQIMDEAEVQCAVLTVDSLALADAAVACDFLRVGETVAMVNIGQSSVSIHFIRDGISNFIRDVNWGARELIQAIAKEYRCDFQEAENRLHEMSSQANTGAPVNEKNVVSEEVTVYAEEEDTSSVVVSNENPFDDPFGEPSVASGSLLDPLDDELGSHAAPTAPSSGSSVFSDSDDKDPVEVLGASLHRLVNEIRRSFDYYEHQLYERPVDRLVLSGGVAHIPLIAEVISGELGIEGVEVANPAQSALFLGDPLGLGDFRVNASKYMVAVGLAARGMADL